MTNVEESRTPPAAAPPALDLLLDLELPLAIRFGRTRMPLGELVRLAPGAVIALDRALDEPLDVLVGDRVVARGELVELEGAYAVRIVQVARCSEVRAMFAHLEE